MLASTVEKLDFLRPGVAEMCAAQLLVDARVDLSSMDAEHRESDIQDVLRRGHVNTQYGLIEKGSGLIAVTTLLEHSMWWNDIVGGRSTFVTRLAVHPNKPLAENASKLLNHVAGITAGNGDEFVVVGDGSVRGNNKDFLLDLGFIETDFDDPLIGGEADTILQVPAIDLLSRTAHQPNI